jgi:hypothetical protein
MITQLTQLERRQLLDERQGAKCHCGARKPKGQSFCNTHYNALPAELRPKLRLLFGKGYEPAYLQARAYLKSVEPQPSLI